ncbi:MAG TPA: ATP-grasp domain-containing protein [Candidatus Limnocylindrales bacterium]|nr:ATP-grasp domain-containing protein [Candidatus Limnocylindrales bacterium]
MLWIVGKLFPNFSDYLNTHNIPYGVMWDVSLPVPASYNMPLIKLDFSHPETLGAQIARISPPAPIRAITVAGYENYVVPAAYIAQALRLTGLTISAAQAATDKLKMRAAFSQSCPHFSSAYSSVESWQDIERFIATNDFPVMLKPASLMKSLLVTRNDSIDQLHTNYKNLYQHLDEMYAKYHVATEPRIIIESFLAGSMHTVAGFVDKTGYSLLIPQIVDCLTAGDIGVRDTYLFSRQLPTTCSTTQQHTIMQAARAGVKALELTNTPVHIEIMLTPAGPKIIEIGARIGGYRARMYQHALGYDLYKAAIDTAYGKSVEVIPQRPACCAALELFPDKQGLFIGIENEHKLQQLPSLRHFSLKCRKGQHIGIASQGYKAAAVIMLVHDSRKQLDLDIQMVRQSVKVLID